MRLLHLTDTHLGARWAVARGPGGPPVGWSRAVDHQQALDRALDLADELDVDAVVHTGDVFDRSKPPWRWVQAAADSLARAARRRPVVVLSGNHDRHGLFRTLPLHVPDLHIVDRPARLRLQTRAGSVVLGCVPYRRNVPGFVHGVRTALAGGADLLLTHQAFDGVVVPGLTFRVGAQRDTVGAQHLQGLPAPQAILCGHIHPRQVVDCGGVPVVHPGCLLHTAVRDRHHPEGVAVWTRGTAWDWRFVDLPGRALLRVRTAADLEAVSPQALVSVRAEPSDAELRSVLMAAVQERGGWLLDRPGSAARASGSRRRDQQLRMFAL